MTNNNISSKAISSLENEQVAGHNPIDTSTISSPKRYVLLIVVGIFIILFDQISKIWVETNISTYRPVKILGDFVRLILAHNYGIIWGIPIRSPLVYYILPLIGIIVVLYLALKTRIKFLTIAFGLIIGGAVGNLIDRVRLGYVIDFIDMGIKNLRWPTYNIADAAIDIGLVMIIAREIFKSKPKP